MNKEKLFVKFVDMIYSQYKFYTYENHNIEPVIIIEDNHAEVLFYEKGYELGKVRFSIPKILVDSFRADSVVFVAMIRGILIYKEQNER